KSSPERIHTLDQLLAFCEVDGSEWEVERWVCNKWEVGAKDKAGEIRVSPLFQVKAWLKRKKRIVPPKAEIEALRAKADSYAPRYPAIIFRDLKASGNLAEYSIVDHHFGAWIWGRETGGADYDTKIAKQCFEDAMTTLVMRTKGYGLDEALI